MGDPAGGAQPGQRGVDDDDPQAEASGRVDRVEWAVCSGVAGDQVAQRVADRLQERLRDPDRQGRPEGVLQPAGVLDRRPALVAGDTNADSAPGVLQLGESLRRAAASSVPRSGRAVAYIDRSMPRVPNNPSGSMKSRCMSISNSAVCGGSTSSASSVKTFFPSTSITPCPRRSSGEAQPPRRWSDVAPMSPVP